MLLAIDTAGSRCSACLFDETARRVLARADPDIGKGHAERLMDEVAGLLDEAGVSYADLTKLAVVVGPGSFTGLRVGVAAARGLSLALGIPAIGVGTLEALAEPHRGAGPVLAILDAKRGEVYAALEDRDGTEIVAPCALGPGDLPGLLAGIGEGASLLAVGSGAAIAAEVLGGRWAVRAMPEACVDIAAVARIAATRAAGPAGPSPLYLRGADAKPPTRGPIERRAGTKDGAGGGELSIVEGNCR